MLKVLVLLGNKWNPKIQTKMESGGMAWWHGKVPREQEGRGGRERKGEEVGGRGQGKGATSQFCLGRMKISQVQRLDFISRKGV